jgi:hypothetical protein
MEAAEEAFIINRYPIKEGLVPFRRQFESIRANLDFVGYHAAVQGVLLSAKSASSG